MLLYDLANQLTGSAAHLITTWDMGYTFRSHR
jgi:hypothetical protein